MLNKKIGRREFLTAMIVLGGCVTGEQASLGKKSKEKEEPQPLKDKNLLLRIFGKDVGKYKLKEIRGKDSPYHFSATYESLEGQVVSAYISWEKNALNRTMEIYGSAEDDTYYLGTTCMARRFRSNYKGRDIFDVSRGCSSGQMIIVLNKNLQADFTYNRDKSDIKIQPWTLAQDFIDIWEKDGWK